MKSHEFKAKTEMWTISLRRFSFVQVSKSRIFGVKCDV